MNAVPSQSLGRIAEVQQGYTFKLKYQGQASGVWPYAKVADLSAHGNTKYLRRTFNYVSDDVLQAIGAKLFPAGSIIFPRVGAALRNNNKRVLVQDSLTDDNVFVITVRDKNVCVPEYLYYWFDFRDLQDFCNSGTVPVINGSALKKQPVPLPHIDAQRLIAHLLSEWDRGIEKYDLLIEAKERYKLGSLASLLSGQSRFSQFIAPRKRWYLGELFQERVEIGRLDLPLLSITREEGIIPRGDVGRKDSSSEDKSKYLRICPGDIGYNTMRMWQGVSALSRYEGLVSPAYTICTPGPDIDGKFASYLFKLPAVVNLFYRYSQGLTSDTWNLKFHHFAEIKVTIPPIDEQMAIASFLSGLDDELAVLKKTKEALVKQKRGLMQKLLTGEWRVTSSNEGIATA
ncbi:MAG: restriction endonuclease subunit S [Steroidobacteraceae bacterium]